MDDNHDPSSKPSRSPASLKYAIGSARAVVEALIARDQNAAEEAALQTCRDCDLLIRLIRDLALLLQDPLNQQFGFDPVATAALVRRAHHVLALVDTSSTRNQSSVASDHDQDDGAEPVSMLRAVRGRTVATLGLRVRLVPFEADGNTNPAAKERKDDASQPGSGDVPPRGVER